jgi:transcription antitermination factor NusA-like protein
VHRITSMIVGLAMSAGLVGCATSSQYVRDDQASRIYAVAENQMYEIVQAAARDAGMRVEQVRQVDGIVDIVAPPSFWTSSLANALKGGDKVTVVIKPNDATSTQVHITSQSQGDAVDFGRSARVVRTLHDRIQKAVSAR